MICCLEEWRVAELVVCHQRRAPDPPCIKRDLLARALLLQGHRPAARAKTIPAEVSPFMDCKVTEHVRRASKLAEGFISDNIFQAVRNEIKALYTDQLPSH